MHRYVCRTGIGIIAWRQASTNETSMTIALRDNHRKFVSRSRGVVSNVGFTNSSLIITTTVGNATADGTTATITTTTQQTITCTPGNAIANGVSASVRGVGLGSSSFMGLMGVGT